MIDNNYLHLESEWGQHWEVNIYLPTAFPAKKKWMRDFDKWFVRQSREPDAWQQVVDYLSRLCDLTKEQQKQINDNIDFIRKTFLPKGGGE